MVLEDLRAGNSVVVSSCPGSGKSTLIYFALADRRHLETDETLILTYNRSLCDSTARRVREDNGDTGSKTHVATFHSCVGTLLGEPGSVQDDFTIYTGLERLSSSLEQSSVYSRCTMLIIDEAQDVRGQFFRLLVHLLTNCMAQSKLQVLCVGDSDQMLYDFLGKTDSADVRYMEKMPRVLDAIIPAPKWRQRSLTVSFRLPPRMATAVNSLLPQHRDITGAGKSLCAAVPVHVHVLDIYKSSAKVLRRLLEGEDLSNVLVLGNSLNQYSATASVVTALKEIHPVCVVRKALSASCLQDRIVFRTMHAAKGLEADVVVVINGDCLLGHAPVRTRKRPHEQTNDLAQPVEEPFRVRNALFVGLTRAKKRLIILQDHKSVSHKELLHLADRAPEGSMTMSISDMPLDSTHARFKRPSTLQKKMGLERLFSFLPSSRSARLIDAIQCYELLPAAPSTTPLDAPAPEYLLSQSATQCVDVEDLHLLAVAFASEMAFREGSGRRGLGTVPQRVLEAVEKITTANEARHGRLIGLKARATRIVPDILDCEDPVRRLQLLAQAGVLCEAAAGKMELSDIRDCGFVMTHGNSVRVERVLNALQSAVGLSPAHTAPVRLNKCKVSVGSTEINLSDTSLLLVTAGPTVCMLAQGLEIVTTERLVAAGLSTLVKRPVALINTHTGQMLEVTGPDNLLGDAVTIKTDLLRNPVDDEGDSDFIRCAQNMVQVSMQQANVIAMMS